MWFLPGFILCGLMLLCGCFSGWHDGGRHDQSGTPDEGLLGSGSQEGTTTEYFSQWAVSVMDSHTTGPGFNTQLVRYFLLSFRLLTTITALSWAFAVVCGRSGKDFPVGSHGMTEGCHVLCLRHGISVWQHIGQSTIATSRHRRDMTSDV